MQDFERTSTSDFGKKRGSSEDHHFDLQVKVKDEMPEASEEKVKQLKRMIEIEEEEAKLKAKWSTIKERAVMRGIQTIFKKYKMNMKGKEKEEFGRLKRRIRNEENRRKRELEQNVRRQTTEQLEILKSVGYRVLTTDNGEHRFVPMCSACHKTNSQLSVCQACMFTWYCDEWCQRKDWDDRHCHQCRTLQMKKASSMFSFKVDENDC